MARAGLDGVLMPLGFQSGQGCNPDPDQLEQVIFCAPQEVLDEHFPRLDVVAGQFPDGGGGCLDLTIEGSLNGGITRVELEGCSLSDLLAGLGLTREADLVRGWPGTSVAADIQRVREAVESLLVAAR